MYYLNNAFVVFRFNEKDTKKSIRSLIILQEFLVFTFFKYGSYLIYM